MKKRECIVLLLLMFCLSQVFTAPCGDVNASGDIDIIDALLIAQHSVGLNPPNFNIAAADANGDSIINIVDALVVAQYYVGLITAVPGCKPPVVGIQKPRIIIMTDSEIDDRACMIRFLMYSSDYDICGIVQVVSKYSNRPSVTLRKWIDDEIDLYEQVLPNLRVHNPDFPEPAHLKSLVKPGNLNYWDLYIEPSKMEVQDTEGSRLIIDTLLDNDPRPVHVAAWAGANTAAFALYRLKTSYSQADYERAVSKIRIYCIWYQDGGGRWIEDNIPGASIFEAFGWDNVWDYQSTSGYNPAAERAVMSKSWLDENVKNNHGALGAFTPQSYVSEGDTASFLNLINNGLRSHEDYTTGGWGGRGIHTIPGKPNYLTDKTILEDDIKSKHFWRWVVDCQTDFQARMDWCVQSSYSGANHAPVAGVTGSYASIAGGLGRNVSPGETVVMDASATTDPDGNSLSYLWWQYYEADSAEAVVSISNNTSLNNASFVVPDEPGKQIQIILEVKDNGLPPLKGYQRIFFTII